MIIAGVDEVGRGPLAGAVVTAAVILDPHKPILGLNDSKKLSEKKRESLAEEIKANALCFAFGRAEVAEIDQLNIFHATMLAMQRAVAGLSVKPEKVLVDGNKTPDFGIASEAIIQGDGKIAEISAASIIAKVARDHEMYSADREYPGYGFAKHKGYPTKHHLEAISVLGVCPIHRTSYAPIQRQLSLL